MLKEYWANALVFDRKYKHGDLLRFRGTVSGIDQVNGGFRVGLTSYGGTVYAGRARCTFLASQSNEVMTLSNGTPATISGRYGGMDLSDGSDPTIIVTDAKLIRRPQQ